MAKEIELTEGIPESAIVKKQEEALTTLRTITNTLFREGQVSQLTRDEILKCASAFSPSDDANRWAKQLIGRGPVKFHIEYGSGYGQDTKTHHHIIEVSSLTLSKEDWEEKLLSLAHS